MKVRVFKLFGREFLRIESHYEATVSDVVRSMIENRARGEEIEVVYQCACDEDAEAERYAEMVADGMIPCECCGEMFDPEEAEEAREVDAKFNDMTERLIWGNPQPDPIWTEPPGEETS